MRYAVMSQYAYFGMHNSQLCTCSRFFVSVEDAEIFFAKRISKFTDLCVHNFDATLQMRVNYLARTYVDCQNESISKAFNFCFMMAAAARLVACKPDIKSGTRLKS
jgi:hypothetical protein